MEVIEALMKIVVKVRDVVMLAKRFREEPTRAMQEVMEHVRGAVAQTLEQVMDAEITLHLANDETNKRNGYRSRKFAVKGLGSVQLRVPRDRKGTYESAVVPSSRRYDEALERDMAALHLAGISTRTLSALSHRLLGVKVSAQEVSNSLDTIVPRARLFLERPLHDRRWMYLYIDGTNFRVRRTTVELEPTLVVLGVDENGHKSVLSMVQGDKENRSCWAMVFAELKERGLDGSAVQLGIMDGLPGMADAFREAFPRARVARCWVHKARNVFPCVPKRYQPEFRVSWDAIQYASDRATAEKAWQSLRERWSSLCDDAVRKVERDIDALLVHYDFPSTHWEALRTTNPFERVNKEFKRRSKAMEHVGPDGLKTLLAFTALRLEFGWQQTSITAHRLQNLAYRKQREARIEELTQGLFN